MLTIVEGEVVYKLGPKVKIAETGTEDSSDTTVPEPPPTSSPPKTSLTTTMTRSPEPAGKFLGETSTYERLNL